MKNYIGIALLIVGGSVSAANVQYNITFDGSITGITPGTGSFIWDDQVNSMSAFTWDFGNGDTGGVTNTYLSTVIDGGSHGAHLFELFTGQNVHPGANFTSTGFSTINIIDLIGPFPLDSATWFGVNHSTKASQYSFTSANLGRLDEGLFSVQAVPLPAAVWLFGSGLVGLLGIARPKAA